MEHTKLREDGSQKLYLQPPLTTWYFKRKKYVNGLKSSSPASDEGPLQWGPANLVRDESQQP